MSDLHVYAAHTRWAREPDRTAATQPGRDGLRAKFEKDIPAGVSGLAREKALRNAMRAHCAKMRAGRAAALKQRREEAEAALAEEIASLDATGLLDAGEA